MAHTLRFETRPGKLASEPNNQTTADFYDADHDRWFDNYLYTGLYDRLSDGLPTSGPTPQKGLIMVSRIEYAARSLKYRVVADARAGGTDWTVIADHFGVTKQAMSQWFTRETAWRAGQRTQQLADAGRVH